MIAASDLSPALASVVMSACGPDAVFVGAWVGSTVVPPMRHGEVAVRGVFAYPAERLAGLRSWRDTVETSLELDGATFHVVLDEASKWARLLLKVHPGPLLWTEAPVLCAADGVGAMSELRALVLALTDDRAGAWLARAGLERTLPASIGPAERFDRIEQWLQTTRRSVSAR